MYNENGTLTSGVSPENAAMWSPADGNCLWGISELSSGLNLKYGQRGVSSIFHFGWRRGGVVTIGDDTFTIPPGVSVDVLDAALRTSDLKLIGTAGEAQDHVLHARMGVEPPGDEQFHRNVLGSSQSVRSIVGGLEDGRMHASLLYRTEVARLSMDHVPLAAPWGAEALGTAPTSMSEATVTSRFRTDVTDLPLHLADVDNTAAYHTFFDRYGTHYASSVVMGGRVELAGSAAMCAQSFQAVVTDADARVELEAALSGASGARVVAVDGVFAGLDATPIVLGGDVDVPGGLDAWSRSVTADPAPIGYALEPIWKLVDDVQVRLAMVTALDSYLSASPLVDTVVQTASPGSQNSSDPMGECQAIPVAPGSNAASSMHRSYWATLLCGIVLLSVVLA